MLEPDATAAPTNPALNAVVLGQTATTVTVRVGAGLAGEDYRVAVVVSTLLGNVLQLDRVIEVVF